MKALLAQITDLFHVPSLHSMIQQQEMEIWELKQELKRARENPGPSFSEVATELPMPELYIAVKQKVIDDLTPILTREATHALTNIFQQMDNEGPRKFHVTQAMEVNTRMHHVRVDFDRMGTIVRVAEL